ncbi:hypothetical protein DK842_17750 [Chromobacterium phragmitis]|uniref:hypothetical protein n=1 Tax=Chromobacterium phragmitis TaxID=2202141 RepID=UPI000DED00C3|nr:hypothetical protein [Chromobacterium phragmitis]AXE31581.1 hypothetical protein DK842_17750 [Chromobacterium phragmitis]
MPDITITKGELFEVLSDSDLSAEFKRRNLDLSLLNTPMSFSFSEEPVELYVDLDEEEHEELLSEASDDALLEQARERGLIPEDRTGNEVFERLNLALSGNDVEQITACAREIYEQSTSRIAG